jgi:hypothetical protein
LARGGRLGQVGLDAGGRGQERAGGREDAGVVGVRQGVRVAIFPPIVLFKLEGREGGRKIGKSA